MNKFTTDQQEDFKIVYERLHKYVRDIGRIKLEIGRMLIDEYNNQDEFGSRKEVVENIMSKKLVCRNTVFEVQRNIMNGKYQNLISTNELIRAYLRYNKDKCHSNITVNQLYKMLQKKFWINGVGVDLSDFSFNKRNCYLLMKKSGYYDYAHRKTNKTKSEYSINAMLIYKKCKKENDFIADFLYMVKVEDRGNSHLSDVKTIKRKDRVFKVNGNEIDTLFNTYIKNIIIDLLKSIRQNLDVERFGLNAVVCNGGVKKGKYDFKNVIFTNETKQVNVEELIEFKEEFNKYCIEECEI